MDKKIGTKAPVQKPRRLLIIVAAYCKTYTEEKARLAKLPGDAYPSGETHPKLEFPELLDFLKKKLEVEF